MYMKTAYFRLRDKGELCVYSFGHHSPAKFVGDDPYAEWPYHSPDAEDSHSKAPDNGADVLVDGLSIPVYPGLVEEVA